MPSVTVVVPTLNEAGNIAPLVDRLAAAFGPHADWEVLFVDDDSSDGTGTEIRKTETRHPVRLIVREGERGLASAVLRGIASTEAPVVLVMDADLSHPPEVAPQLAKAVEEGADVAIGSRYVPGGGTEGWSRMRLFLSRGAAFLTRGLTTARDPGAGFFAIKKSLLAGTNLKVEGFKILLEILAKLRPARIAEIPIQFAPRHAGKSKVAAGTALAYLKQLARLYAVRPAAQVVTLIGLLFAIKVFVGAWAELDSIEAYHWLYAQHPALGYYDHPGMIGWIIWLSTAIFGDSALGVRMLTLIGSSLGIWLVFLAGRRLYDERAARLGAVLFAVAFGPLKFGAFATPDAPLLLFWMAGVWALSHALTDGRTRWWILSGAFVGLAMLSKYMAIFLPAGLLLFLVLSREHRKWLLRVEPYLAALVAIAVFSPAIAWNATHEWQSFEYQSAGRLSNTKPITGRYLGEVTVGQLLHLTPLAAVWGWAAGLGSLFRRKAPWQDRFLASVAMPILLFFMGAALFRSVRSHWLLAGGATLLLLVGATATRGRRLWQGIHLGIAGLCLVGILLGVAYFVTDTRKGPTPWRDLAAKVRELKPDFIVAQDYHVAAQLAYYARPIVAVDFTAVGSGGKSFRLWWKGYEHAGHDAVIVWSAKKHPVEFEKVLEHFKEVGSANEVTVNRALLESEDFILVKARGYKP